MKKSKKNEDQEVKEEKEEKVVEEIKEEKKKENLKNFLFTDARIKGRNGVVIKAKNQVEAIQKYKELLNSNS